MIFCILWECDNTVFLLVSFHLTSVWMMSFSEFYVDDVDEKRKSTYTDAV